MRSRQAIPARCHAILVRSRFSTRLRQSTLCGRNHHATRGCQRRRAAHSAARTVSGNSPHLWPIIQQPDRSLPSLLPCRQMSEHYSGGYSNGGSTGRRGPPVTNSFAVDIRSREMEREGWRCIRGGPFQHFGKFVGSTTGNRLRYALKRMIASLRGSSGAMFVTVGGVVGAFHWLRSRDRHGPARASSLGRELPAV